MTSRELLEHIKKSPSFIGGDSRYLGVSNSSDLFLKDCEQIEKDLKFLEILKERFCIKSCTLGWGCFMAISGIEKDLDNYGIDHIAISDMLQNEEQIEFLKEYLKENNNDK